MKHLVQAVILSLSTALVAAPVFAAQAEQQPAKTQAATQQHVHKAADASKPVAVKKQSKTPTPAVQKKKEAPKKATSKKVTPQNHTQPQHKTGEKKPVKAA